MNEYLHSAHVANVVTSFALLWAGILITIFWFLERNQPLRWLFFYLTVVITAIPTIIHHIMPKNLCWTSLDIMSNILVVVALELGLIGDYFSGSVQKSLWVVIGFLNLFVILYLVSIIFLPIPHIYLPLGRSKGFTLGEIALILNAIMVVIILGTNYTKLRRKEKAVFWGIVLTFLFGLFFATGSDDYIYPRYIGWHSMWHILGSYGFILFWYFNHLRFSY